jgi:hypothetical protein
VVRSSVNGYRVSFVVCSAELWDFVSESWTIGATDHQLNRTVLIIETSQLWDCEGIAQDRSVNPTEKHMGMILLRRMGAFQL